MRLQPALLPSCVNERELQGRPTMLVASAGPVLGRFNHFQGGRVSGISSVMEERFLIALDCRVIARRSPLPPRLVW